MRISRRTTALVTAAILALGLVGWTVLRSSTNAATATRSTESTTTSRQPADAGGPGWVRRENAKKGSTAWRINSRSLADDTQLAGYADHASIRPGDPLRLFVTTTAHSFTVKAFRLGWYGGARGRLVWQSPSAVPGRRQARAVIDSHRMVTTRWKPSTTVKTDGWPEGTYLLLLTDSRGLKKYVPVTVRSNGVSGRLVLVNAVTTYQAYNAWGGHSLYGGPGNSFATRSSMVSFDRPYDNNGAQSVTLFEQPIIAEAERSNLPLAYLTSIELDANLHALDGARGVVSLGHDEYWSVGMRHAVTTARDAGANLAFLGANAVYWRVRLAPSPMGARRVVVGYKSANDPVNGATTTVKWRDRPQPLAENSLTGMLYECFPARGALVVRDPGFFLFHGTGATKGSRYAGLVGTEIDRAYPLLGTPDNLQVVAHSPVVCGQGKHTSSDATYYSTPAGAGVFAVGSMLWGKGLGGTNTKYGIDLRAVTFARTVTANLFSAMAAGPMGKAHPAKGDLGSLHASTSTTHGTGGPLAR
jgi:hypothetical protein